MEILGWQKQNPGMPGMKMIVMIDDNGVRWSVPDDMDNSDRQKIKAWEDEGNVIPDEAPPDV